MSSTYIFIDGSFLWYTLRHLGKWNRKDPLSEVNIDWREFSKYITEHVTKSVGKETELRKLFIFKAKRIQPWGGGGNPPEGYVEIEKKYRGQLGYYTHVTESFSKLELLKVGHLKYSKETNKEGVKKVIIKGEKGVDVGLVLRMVRLLQEDETCENIVLISGDADYIPLFEYVSEKYPRVNRFLVEIKSGEPPESRGVAGDLGDTAGNRIQIYERGRDNQKGLRDLLVPEEARR